jgi:hypothetical protein
MLCPRCHGPVLTSKKKVLGLNLYYCKACECKGVEGDSRWPFTGPGHEQQLLDMAVEIATQDARMRAFLSGEFDHGFGVDVFSMGG